MISKDKACSHSASDVIKAAPTATAAVIEHRAVAVGVTEEAGGASRVGP